MRIHITREVMLTSEVEHNDVKSTMCRAYQNQEHRIT